MVEKEEKIKLIKGVTKEILKAHGLQVKKIILFGSRAKGIEKETSDWDIYVIVDRELDFSKRKKIHSLIRKKLAEEGISVDILLHSQGTFEARKKDVGYLDYYVAKEGKEI